MIFFNRMKNTLPKKESQHQILSLGKKFNVLSSLIFRIFYHDLHIILLINHLQ